MAMPDGALERHIAPGEERDREKGDPEEAAGAGAALRVSERTARPPLDPAPRLIFLDKGVGYVHARHAI